MLLVRPERAQLEGLQDTKEHRYRCLVRQMCRWHVERGQAWVNAWLEDLGKKRPVSRLRRDYLDQVGKGNQGAWGDWL